MRYGVFVYFGGLCLVFFRYFYFLGSRALCELGYEVTGVRVDTL